MNTNATESSTETEPLKVLVSNYGPDSPSYTGPVMLALDGGTLVYSREDYEGKRPSKGTTLPWHHQSGTLPVTLPKLVKVVDFNAAMHSQLLRDNFSMQDELSYLGKSDNLEVEGDHIKVLEFEDGSQGYFMIHGESCYFTLVVVGHIRVEVEAYGDDGDELIFTTY